MRLSKVFSLVVVGIHVFLVGPKVAAKLVYTPASSISTSQWAQLNETVGGRLQRALPYSAPCFSIVNGLNVTPDVELCTIRQENFTNPFYRIEQFGAWMEVCMRMIWAEWGFA